MVHPDQLNITDPRSVAPRALELTRPMWIALGLVLLIGLQRFVSPQVENEQLGYLNPKRISVQRSTDTLHVFNQLGIQVPVSDGWAYLSTSQDAIAMAPTFSHAESGSILRLQPFHLEQWPPEDSVSQQIDDGGFQMLWVPVGRLLVGRLILGDSDLAVVVMGHGRGSQISNEILDFCRRVQSVDS